MCFFQGKSDGEERTEEKKLEYSPLRTYSDTRHNRKRNPQASQTGTAQEPQSLHGSVSNPEAKNSSKEGPLNQSRKKNELIDLFEEISAEQLLIEPKEMNTEDIGSFDHAKWLEKLAQNVGEEDKVPNAY